MSRITIIFLFVCSVLSAQESKKLIARQGQVSFFSYTSVENIKAENNQVLSIIDFNNNSIAVSMLMNAFVFEKALMREHFNESYIESDIYPTATFEGDILDFDPNSKTIQTKIIKGVFEMHGQKEELEIKVKVANNNGVFSVSGSFETLVKSYDINIPPLLAGNIAKSIEVNFKFEYEPYEN
ncbi:MAG: YceI family protein [Winogradskyella sp.]|uniref:YceI family protein n=1 Tax=Winogradskyella sp. TaxID=1883156 RepID=UPI000F3BDDAB|nr:YceI family protein [Winogradskyella sp.]RNC88285.1 MAG: YceI family protein [Winogradskyella sp.]